MPIRRTHQKIDENVLKSYRLIPAGMDTSSWHKAIDEGKEGGELHRVLDKWHNPRYMANIGLNTKLKSTYKKMSVSEYRERNYIYRITMMHIIVDELSTRFKNRKGHYPTYDKLERMVKRRVSQKAWVRRHFNL